MSILTGLRSQLKVVDAHTMGEFCRILVGGIPEPQGNTMIEKKKWLEENCDYIRTALMLEPRGHHDMFVQYFASRYMRKRILALYSWRQVNF